MKEQANEELANAAVKLTEAINNPISQAVIQFTSDNQRFPDHYVTIEDKYKGRFTVKYEGIDTYYGGTYSLRSYGQGCHIMMKLEDFTFVQPAGLGTWYVARLLKEVNEMITYLGSELPRPLQIKAA